MADTLTYEKVLEMFKETDRKMQETDRIVKETALQMKETDRRMKETDKRIGDLGNRFGDLIEHMVAPNIKEKFNELGFTFERIYKNLEISNHTGNNFAEIDLVLENGDIVIVVEVKATAKVNDVNYLIKKMEILRRTADLKNDKRKYRGAIASAITSTAVRNYSHKKGFYVIEQTGDTVKITIPEGFVPREW